MRRVSAAVAALAMATLGVALFTAGPAAGQMSCEGTETASPATITPTSVLPGESVTLTGSGFAANQVLGVGLFRPAVVLASVASSTTGTYTAVVQIPEGTPPGQNEITVFGVGANNTCHQSLALFTVREPAPLVTVVTLVFPPPTIIPATIPTPIVVQQPLARTGSPSLPLVAAGLLLTLLGVHAVRASNKRTILG